MPKSLPAPYSKPWIGLAFLGLALSACGPHPRGQQAPRRPHGANAAVRWRSPVATSRVPPPFPTLEAPPAPPEPADTPDRFVDIEAAAYEAERIEDFERAIALRRVLVDEQGPDAAYDLGSLYARARETDAALYYLQLAYRENEATTDLLDRDTNLASLRSDPRFEALKDYARAIDEFWERSHHRLVRVTVPTGYDGRAPLPTLVALHGYRSEPGDFFDDPMWQALADARSIAIVSVSGTRAHAQRKFEWTCDVATDLRHVRDALSSVRSELTIDRNHLILIGFSQGGDVGLRILDTAPMEFRGLVSMSPGALGGAPAFESIDGDLHGHTVVVTVGAGEHPINREHARRQARMADAAGARVRHREVAGQNIHTFPDDLETELPTWLTEIDGVFAP